MNISRRQVVKAGAAAFAFGAASFAGSAAADNYPSRPIRFVVPMPPGGGTDFWARLSTTAMGRTLNTQFLVDNKPGAGTRIAAEQVMRAAPDGYTLMVGDMGTFAVNPGLYPKLGYDPLQDFVPITLTVRQALMLVVPASSPIDSVKTLIAKCKAAPGSLNYGSAGIASPHHLAMEMFQSLANVRLSHIPYKGGAPLALDLLGGQVSAGFLDLPSAMPHLKSGKLRGLAVFSAKRLSAFPEIPTMAEAGFPGQVVEAWQGLVAPKGTDPSVVALINRAYAESSKDADVVRKLDEMGMEATPSTPAAFTQLIIAETQKWAALIREKNIKPE
jgi:tripartite-type tricarboxylate transporter receptor subunit TctC